MNDADSESRRRQLETGLQAMDLDLPEAARSRLLAYIDLLAKWNQAFNLTAVRDPRQMVARHLLDSLAILPWLRGPRILDVGTGAGLPGIPLAIARPQWRFTLLDSNGKKTRFVHQAGLNLGLENVEVRQARVEALHDPLGFDSITSRAFAALAEFVGVSRHLLAPGGCWLAMKAGDIDAELTALAALEVFDRPPLIERRPLSIPGGPAGRQLVLISRQAD